MVKMFKALEYTGLRVINAVQGKFVGISEEQFVGAFGLPIAGLKDMTEVPKDLVYDARSIFSVSDEPVNTSCKKREMKFAFCLQNDILAKSVTVKAGSFDAVTHERFLLMTAINFGVKINWSKILFDILKEMAKTFPPLKIPTVKIVGMYVSKNKNITADEDEPVEKVVKKAATKMRPAPAIVDPATKKKRTAVGRAAPIEKDLSIVPVRKLVLRDDFDDETVENIIDQVIKERAEIVGMETDLEEPAVMETAGTYPVETESRIDVSAITNYDEDSSLKVLSNEEGPLVETEKENEKEKDKEKSFAKMIDSIDTEPLSKVMDLTETFKSDEESMSIDDLLAQIPEDMMLPSVTAAEPTKIKFGHGIQIKEKYWYKASLPQIDLADKGKAPLVEDVKVIEEISSFFYSFSLCRLAILESVSDIAAKEEQILAWAETDSLQTAMRQHKLEWIRPSASNLFGRGDIQRGGILSRFHPSIKYWIRRMITIAGSWTVIEGMDRWVRECSSTTSSERMQLIQEPAVATLALICIFVEPVQDPDTRPPFSGRWGWTKVCTDVVQFSLFGHLLPVGFYNLCTDIVFVGTIIDLEADRTGFFGVFQRGLDANLISSSSSSSRSENLNPSSPSSSSDSPMHFTADDIPEIPYFDDVLPDEEIPDVQISLPTASVPSIDYTEAFAQLRAIVDQTSIEQVQTRFHLDELKAVLSKRISNLETVFLTTSDNQDRAVLVQTNILRRRCKIRRLLCLKNWLMFENYNTLCAHLAELIAYMNRGRDDKKGEVSSSRGPQPPEDRSRPGSGDSGRGRGSSSEPSRKIGSGYRGGGSTSSRGFRYWLGGS
ncbi:hypothetical protein F511_21879 [Dorcoceras hygrometricum]|uniref:Splicing factor 3B subunit 1-like n=1 Tax=Dorcoceras hygrometricum TaxID=472368 RepID=A0A2Z7AG15_9LAMI|nr:hypothetical protein F511_21879 [Dorcoceras hygrometricum]